MDITSQGCVVVCEWIEQHSAYLFINFFKVLLLCCIIAFLSCQGQKEQVECWSTRETQRDGPQSWTARGAGLWPWSCYGIWNMERLWAVATCDET